MASLPFPTPPPRRRRKQKDKIRSYTLPTILGPHLDNSPGMATRNDPEGAVCNTTNEPQCLSLDHRPGRRATEANIRPRSAETRNIQQISEMRRYSIAGCVVENKHSPNVKGLTFPEHKTSKLKKESSPRLEAKQAAKEKGRSRTRSNSLSGLNDEQDGPEIKVGLCAASACGDIPKLVEEATHPEDKQTQKEKNIKAKLCELEEYQPSHVKLPDIGEVVHKKKKQHVENTSKPLMSDSVLHKEDETDIFECGICTEALTIPKSLPCLHTFCLQCLEKYFSSSGVDDGSEFRCPTCRAKSTLPKDGGAIRLPTNFHIEKLQRSTTKNSSSSGVMKTVTDALASLEQREIDVVEELGERKRRELAVIGMQRERFVCALDDYLEGLQVMLEDRHTKDADNIVDVIHTMKHKLETLQQFLIAENKTEIGDSLKNDAVDKLKFQGEVITNIANELEEIKVNVTSQVDAILHYQLKFQHGDSDSIRFSTQFGKIAEKQIDKKGEEINKTTQKTQGHLSQIANDKSWVMFAIGLLPVLFFFYLVRLIANMVK